MYPGAVPGIFRPEDNVPERPIIDTNLCQVCGDCVKACPDKALSINEQGTAIVLDIARCSGNGKCEEVCPQDAIDLVPG